MGRIERDDVTDAVEAIRRYLASRPNATETLEGVAKWWLLRQRYDDSIEVVQRALERLEAEGEVVKLNVTGGQVIYRRSVSH